MFSYRDLMAAAIAATFLVLPTAGRADTYDLTVDNCSGGCNPGSAGTSMGTVTVTQDGLNQVEIDVSLVSPLEFVNTGLVNTIDFNIVGTPTISLVSSSNSNFSLSSTSAGSNHFDGFGSFEYTLELSTAQGAGGAQASPEDFVISASGLTVADLETNGNSANAFFGVDVYNTVNGNTGPIGSSFVAPLPGALVLFGSVLFGGLGFSSWRKRNGRSAAASVIA